MLELEVLIGELGAVDGLATSAVVVGEVTALQHELGDDTAEVSGLVGLMCDGTERATDTSTREFVCLPKTKSPHFACPNVTSYVPVERRSLVAKAVLAGAKLAKVGCA